MTGTFTEITQQPYFGELPIPRYGIGRKLHHLGRFFHTKAAKEAEFNHSTLAWVHDGQPFQRLINSQNIGVWLGSHEQRLIKIHARHSASSFLISARACEIDQDAA